LKSEALRVAIVRDTEILEIRVTLPDPKTAHALAIYLADQTVNLNRAVNAEGEQERLAAVEKEEIAARARLDQSEAQWTRLVAQQPFEVLQQSIQSTTYLKGNLELQLLRAEMDASDPQGPDPDGDHARAKILRKQIADTEQQISREEALLAHRLAERDRLTAERTDSQTAYAAVENRLRQVRADLGYHGERLRIIDPGVIPERPSSPSLIPNVFAAFLLGMVAAIVYLMLSLSYQAQRASARRSTLRLAAGSED
jgi:capsule polysaccharide export protein KpsE/RkpR